LLIVDCECVLFNDDMDMLASLTAISDLTNKFQVMRNYSILAFRKLYEVACATCCTPSIGIALPTATDRQYTEENKHLITCKDNL